MPRRSGPNRITVEQQQQLINVSVKNARNSLQLDAEFAANFKKLPPVLTEIKADKTAPFESLGNYIDFAMFDEKYGYYTNKVQIGLDNGVDFTTQLHDGCNFVYGILVQAYNVWLTQLMAGTRTRTDIFNIVEPGAGVGIFALKLLFLLDNFDMDSPHLTAQQKENWQTFVNQLRLHLSDRSPLQVNHIKNNLVKNANVLQNQSLLEKVHVACCALSDISIPADFLIIQEVFDVLPIERVKFTAEGIKVAIVVPAQIGSTRQDQELVAWLLQHSELTAADLQGKTVLTSHQDQLNKIVWLETFVSIDHFPEIKRQVMRCYDYYTNLAALTKDNTINIRRYLAENLALCQHLRGAALIFDYGHTCKDVEKDNDHPWHEIRLFPQDTLNSKSIKSNLPQVGFFGLNKRITFKQAYLLKPGQYDITADVDFSELLHYVDDQHVPVCYGSQVVTASNHFLKIIRSMPYFTNNFINNQYLPAYESECYKFSEPYFDLESPLVVSLRLFTKYIDAHDDFKQLMITDKAFAQLLKGHYRFGFEPEPQKVVQEEKEEYCGFKRGFLLGKRF